MLQTDEIIEMARQAGMVQDGDVWFSANNSEQCDVHTAELEAFAKLVATKEREACAKVCDDINAVYNKPEDAAERVASQWCAERIRARGEA